MNWAETTARDRTLASVKNVEKSEKDVAQAHVSGEKSPRKRRLELVQLADWANFRTALLK